MRTASEKISEFHWIGDQGEHGFPVQPSRLIVNARGIVGFRVEKVKLCGTASGMTKGGWSDPPRRDKLWGAGNDHLVGHMAKDFSHEKNQVNDSGASDVRFV